MSRQLEGFTKGPSLPPNVNGGLIGTLTVSFQACSIDNVFARVQFWGERIFSDLCLKRNTSAPVSCHAVEYPLIGSIPALHNYLKDASPLNISFFRCHQPSPTGNIYKPELVGVGQIVDLCIGDLLGLQSAHKGTSETIKLSLQRELQIVSSESEVNGFNSYVGKAVFELLFRVTPPPAATSQLQREAVKQGAQTIVPELNQVVDLPVKHDISSNPTNEASHDHISRLQSTYSHPLKHQLPCIPSYDGITSMIDDSSGHRSYLNSSVADKQSLLEELLDLCADDMTMPTIDSAISCFDPYDQWISRLVANAASPPAEGFPSLEREGSHQSNALRKIGLLKIEVDKLTLFVEMGKKMKGKHDFHLQYNPPPVTARAGLTDPIEFMVCEQFGTTAARKEPSTLLRPKPKGGKKGNVLLQTSPHTEHMEVDFKDDDSVRRWLDGTMNFCLIYRASKSGRYQKLPRVAMLASKNNSKAASSETTPEKLCIAKARLRLRSLILSDRLAVNLELDLISTNDDVFDDNGKGTKVGSLNVHLGLHQNTKSPDCSIPSCPTYLSAEQGKAGVNSHILMKGVQCSSTLTPHPISMFLSNFAAAANGNVSTVAQESTSHNASYAEGGHLHGLTPHIASLPCATTKNEDPKIHSDPMIAPLKPVEAPPRWLEIRIEHISNLCTGPDNDGSGCLQLSMSFSKPILSSGKPSHPIESELYSQDLLPSGTNEGGKITVTDPCCSWQVAVKAENEEASAAFITLRIWYCSDNDGNNKGEKALLGVTKIPFLIEPEHSLQQRICNWLPCIATNGWFDVVDPTCNAPIGKIQVIVASGMLRQIRGFSQLLKSVLKVQIWWRRRHMPVSKENKQERTEPQVRPDNAIGAHTARKYPSKESEQEHEGPQVEPESPTGVNAAREYDPEFDTVHAGFMAHHERDSLRRIDRPASSPDSLFEEWSQQSLSVIHGDEDEREHIDMVAAKRAADATQHETCELIGSPEMSKSCDEATKATGTTEATNKVNVDKKPEEESDSESYEEINEAIEAEGTTEEINSNEANNVNCEKNAEGNSKSVVPSTGSESDDEASIAKATAPDPSECNHLDFEDLHAEDAICCNHLDILVRLEKICGLREILSVWCGHRGSSERESLYAVSGIFVSCFVRRDNAVVEQQEELRELCVGGSGVWHSQVLPVETITRDVELNLESTMSIPNHETNTEMILNQTLEYRLWFVPVVTAAISTMINGNRTKDIKSLNGCTIIASAKCPLYHIYTLKGHFTGRLPWNVHTKPTDQTLIGCIATSICRKDCSPIVSFPESKEEYSASNGKQDHVMSILKPMNLEVSFSHRQDGCIRRNTGIDPPEEISHPCTKSSSNKRKMDNNSDRSMKRYRVKEDPNISTLRDASLPMAKPLPEKEHDNVTSEEKDIDEDSKTICPSEGSFGSESDSDIEDPLIYRSLTSVIGSLDNINSRLQFCERKEVAPAEINIGPDIGLECDDTCKHSPFPKPSNIYGPKSNVSSHDSVRLNPGRQMEPPEQNCCPETPMKLNSTGKESIRTCEKGTSTLTHHHVDASTSPCGESLTAGIDDEMTSMPKDNSIRDDINRPEDYAKKQDVNCQAKKQEMNAKCENDETNLTDNNKDEECGQDDLTSSALRKSKGGKLQYHESRVRYTHHYLGRGFLDGSPKRYSSRLFTPSYSRERVRFSPCLGGRSSTIKPKKASLTPTSNTEEGQQPHGRKEFMTAHKDRLERIFQCK